MPFGNQIDAPGMMDSCQGREVGVRSIDRNDVVGGSGAEPDQSWMLTTDINYGIHSDLCEL